MTSTMYYRNSTPHALLGKVVLAKLIAEYKQELYLTVSRFSLKFWLIAPSFMVTLFFFIVLANYLVAGEIQVELLAVLVPLLCVVVFMTIAHTRRVTARINMIIQAAEKVAHGDFSIQIADNHHDEIGQSVQAFNQMVQDLASLQNSRNLLSCTMSPAVRQSLIERGLDFRGISQVVGVLSIDIRGFTRLTERYNTEQLVFFLNDYYTTIAKQVHSGGGIIGKYAGDSILAFFGAPTPQPPTVSATQALLTAMALRDAIAELSERWSLLGMPQVRTGIGVSLGPVVAGPIGSEEQFEYTVIGDSVNLAARLQDLTRNVEGYSMMVGAEVYEVLADPLKSQIEIRTLDERESLKEKPRPNALTRFVDFGDVLVKGKKGPVHVYAVPSGEREPQDPLMWF